MKQLKTPKMSRIHYAFIADVIANMNFDEKAMLAPNEYVATMFTEALRKTNPNFKAGRFFDAALLLTKDVKKTKSPSRSRRKSNASSPTRSRNSG